MSYENPRIPEGINVSRESAVVEFLRLAAAIALLLSALAAALYVGGGWLARQLPFAMEQRWVGEEIAGLEPFAHAADAPAAAHVQQLTTRLAAHMDLPEGMGLRVRLVQEATPNAFATLGGHIVVTDGLYRRMPSENALAMVIAHEIAHIRARDPIAALGGSAVLALAAVLVSGNADAMTAQMSRVVQLGYSRAAESRADTLALEALRALYGHAGGAAAVFETLAADKDELSGLLPTLLSTHPADSERIARLRAAARDHDPRLQPLVPMPALP
jgi:beta-barrel assembly-enhancing protease